MNLIIYSTFYYVMIDLFFDFHLLLLKSERNVFNLFFKNLGINYYLDTLVTFLTTVTKMLLHPLDLKL